MEDVFDLQVNALEDSNGYVTAWKEALQKYYSESNNQKYHKKQISWGGRGQGGRGTGRYTVQPHDVLLPDAAIRLEYVGESSASTSTTLLLEETPLKLLSRHIYGLIGRNGSGKSTLLRALHTKTSLPGFPASHVSTCYIPQELYLTSAAASSLDDCDDAPASTSVQEVLQKILDEFEKVNQCCQASSEKILEDLYQRLEQIDVHAQQEEFERINEEIAQLEEETNDTDLKGISTDKQFVAEALGAWGFSTTILAERISSFSAGERKKLLLTLPYLHCSRSSSSTNLVLLDEPTTHLDVTGLLQLREMIDSLVTDPVKNNIVLLISHDVDLLRTIPTDIVELSEKQLHYYPGNYSHYQMYKRQNKLHLLRQVVTLDKKRQAMAESCKKKNENAKQVKHKINKMGIPGNAHGHRYTAQKDGGIRPGSINSVDASTRRGMSTQQLLQLTTQNILPPPDKAVQFEFSKPHSNYGEPLILAYELGFGFGLTTERNSSPVMEKSPNGEIRIVKKDGFLFDTVDLCIDEGSNYCILGPTGCGKSTLLRLLAGFYEPLEGKIARVPSLEVGFMDQEQIDRLITEGHLSRGNSLHPLSFLQQNYPEKSEQDIRGELSSFGLNNNQVLTNLKFLSGGERTRLYLAFMMLKHPDILIIDEPTANLDVESVEALIYGINRWAGTVIICSHDAHFIRSIDAKCFVMMPDEGKLRFVVGGVDEYLKSYAMG